MLADHLSFIGYEVSTSSDGLDGLKKIKENQYDLIITDLSMPYVSGIGIISILKKDHPEIPVIAITGFGYYAEELAHEKKADAILSKPFDIQQLKETVAGFLEK